MQAVQCPLPERFSGSHMGLMRMAIFPLFAQATCACRPTKPDHHQWWVPTQVSMPTHNTIVTRFDKFSSWHCRAQILFCAWLFPAWQWMVIPSAYALDTNKRLSDLMHQSWSVDEGLPHSTVRAIAQTADGYLWFATHEGAVRFDGVSFSVFNQESAPALVGSGIASLLKAADGSLILGLRDRGLVRLVGGKKFDTLDPTGILPAGSVSLLAEDAKGAIWAGVDNAGIARIGRDPTDDSRLFTTDDGLPANNVNAVRILQNGALWVGTPRGLAVFRDGKFVPNPTGIWLDTASIAAIVEDREKRLWIATNGQGVAVREGQTWRRVGRSEGLASAALTRMMVDRNGGVWIGSLEGIYRLSGNRIERFGTPDGFTNNNVRDIFEDAEGGVWIGTDRGVNRFRDATITTWGVRKGISEEFTRAVMEDQRGRLWVGTSDGLFSIAGETTGRYGRSQGLLNGAVLSLAQDTSGTIWIGTNGGGIHRLNGEKIEVLSKKLGISDVPVRAILAARDGALWLGTSAGLVQSSWKSSVNSNGTARVWLRADGLPSEQISALHEDAAGRLWIGTRNGLGMLAADGNSIDGRTLGITATVLAINADTEGRLWISTTRGLEMVTANNSAGGFSVRRLLPVEGVPAQAYFSVLDDHGGFLWTCGNRGIARFGKGEIADLIAGKRKSIEPTYFGRADGMATAQCNGASQPAAWRTRDGRLMFATARGVAIVEPGRETTRDLGAPPVNIKDVLIDSERVMFETGRRIDIPAGKHRVEISYVGLSLADPEKVRYRYRLVGFDPDWVEAGRESKAIFTNIRPGNYRFQVAASRVGGPWSAVGAELELEQEAHFYESLWFKWLASLLIIVAGVGVYWARVTQLNARGRQLQSMVDERTLALEQEKQKLEDANQEKARLLIQVAEAAKSYEKLAKEDGLTGLANRRELDRNLTLEFDRASRNARPLSLALADLDYFKKINDQYSHAVGDDVLRAVANILAEGCRKHDTVGRYGGEEFLLVLPETDSQAAWIICERLRVTIERHDWSVIAANLTVTMSFGIGTRSDETTVDRLLAIADTHLYQSKADGRNRVTR